MMRLFIFRIQMWYEFFPSPFSQGHLKKSNNVVLYQLNSFISLQLFQALFKIKTKELLLLLFWHYSAKILTSS